MDSDLPTGIAGALVAAGFPGDLDYLCVIEERYDSE
jgi:hypothetical protein